MPPRRRRRVPRVRTVGYHHLHRPAVILRPYRIQRSPDRPGGVARRYDDRHQRTGRGLAAAARRPRRLRQLRRRRPIPPQHPPRRPQQQPQVGKKTLPLQIRQIHPQLFRQQRPNIIILKIIPGPSQQLLLVDILHISRADQTGPYAEHPPLLRGIVGKITGVLRPGSHQAHLPLQHIPQLRQFIQLVIPQPSPHPGHPRVPGRRNPGRRRRPFLPHRAELIHHKGLPPLADAYRPVDDHPRRTDLHQQRNAQQNRRQQQQAAAGHHAVKTPLQHRPHLGRNSQSREKVTLATNLPRRLPPGKDIRLTRCAPAAVNRRESSAIPTNPPPSAA